MHQPKINLVQYFNENPSVSAIHLFAQEVIVDQDIILQRRLGKFPADLTITFLASLTDKCSLRKQLLPLKGNVQVLTGLPVRELPNIMTISR